MKLIVFGADDAILGAEHIDGLRWVTRADHFENIDNVYVHLKQLAKPQRFVITNNGGVVIARGVMSVEMKGEAVAFFRGQLRVHMRPD